MSALGATLLIVVLAATGCAGAARDKLLVADAPDGSGSGLNLWAAAPGDKLSDDNLVASGVVGRASVATRLDDGALWVNGLGRYWKNTALLSYSGDTDTVLSTVDPGADPEQLATATAMTTTVIRRGAYVQTTDGCKLATTTDSTEDVGTGQCSMSSDERWVVSWPSSATSTGAAGADSTSLTILDLRHDDDTDDGHAIKGLGNVVQAVALSKDARIFAVVQPSEDEYQGVILDATDGSEVGRTDTFSFMELGTVNAESTGFVFQTTEDTSATLWYADTEADVRKIDDSVLLQVVDNGAEITYISFDENLTDSSVREWTPGDDEPEVLLKGQVGAGMADGHLVVLREVPADAAKGTGPTEEYWRPGAGHELEKVLTVPAPDDTTPISEGGTGAIVSTAWVQGHTLHMQVGHEQTQSAPATSSYVRIDLTGDHSDAPIENSSSLQLQSLDVDGTALLTEDVAGGSNDDSASGSNALVKVMVIGPHDDEPVTRGTYSSVQLALIHEGAIYMTVVEGTGNEAAVSVRSVRATGDADPELLWKDRQLGGATWAEQNGATESSVITVGALIAANNAAQQQAAAASGATASSGSSTAGGDSTGGAAAGG